ncbi:cobalamin-binding protein [Salinibacter sp. 10B]|uniref:helical backbone metal receptor n=1 Tax=Salinibacter sp. 10B TaxID=1923971 RepID=UPI000CF3E149|nr:helical backbone metal receptor [Salinibacter sp. 10B]PQJ33711.1 cobalamin-binding protein [Salinibacter sp. 10B]
MPQVTDARGTTIRLPAPPRRIVSLVPSQTELLSHLGLDETVVGITRFCERPSHWQSEKPIVGGTKEVDLDQVRDLEPDLVLANHEENTREDVAALEDIAPVFVTEVRTVTGALDMIRAVGTLTATTDQTSTLAGRIISRFSSLPDFAPLRSAYLIWRDPYMTVGGDTFIHDVMSWGGFENVYGEQPRYPEVSLDSLAERDLDVLLCSSEPFPFHQKDRFTADLRDALPNVTVELVDGQPFSWYGPRLLDTPAYLHDLRQTLPTPQQA